MSKGYRPYLPDQDLLLPPSLQEWLPEGHLVYFVSDVVNQLDLSAVHAVYGEEKRGQPPYDPRLMIKLLVYGYCTGVFSSRRIQKRLQENFRFGCWRRATTQTFGRSPTSARFTSRRCKISLNKCCRWRWSRERGNWVGCQ